ncbi:hypothetical protein [Novosphingopyxis sp.]|uniref:hypothetical protein n=1 Tax=Novosphingopyxis sp. TaxID=2709690 RepID=UPI003B58CBDA
MSEAFAQRSFDGGAAAFRPVWQVPPQPFRTAADNDSHVGSGVDEEADAEAYFQEQLDDSYRRGFADGQAAIAEANAELIAASDRLGEAVTGLKSQPGDALCETLLRTIRTLLERTAGFSEPDAATLQKHCASLAALAEKDCSNAILHIHPLDRMLLGEHHFDLSFEEDPSMTRGTLCLAHSEGWIEQGTKPVLDELEAMIASLGDTR